MRASSRGDSEVEVGLDGFEEAEAALLPRVV